MKLKEKATDPRLGSTASARPHALGGELDYQRTWRKEMLSGGGFRAYSTLSAEGEVERELILEWATSTVRHVLGLCGRESSSDLRPIGQASHVPKESLPPGG